MSLGLLGRNYEGGYKVITIEMREIPVADLVEGEAPQGYLPRNAISLDTTPDPQLPVPECKP